ncbi:hypothetical protein B0H13DRAFT_1656296 [Mycena leptocephala]|nr:hypothetical protein B0H13DRAFT_1656296 [Mycena leptocephala]
MKAVGSKTQQSHLLQVPTSCASKTLANHHPALSDPSLHFESTLSLLRRQRSSNAWVFLIAFRRKFWAEGTKSVWEQRCQFSSSIHDAHTDVHDQRKVKPSGLDYALEATKIVPSTIKSLSEFIPVPLVGEVAEVAIRVLEMCQEATKIEEDAKDLEDRIYRLSLAIIHAIHGKPQQELQERIVHIKSYVILISKCGGLLIAIRIFANIMSELQGIKEQKNWLLALFRDLNRERLGKCNKSVNEALQEFNISHEIRVEELLHSVKSQYDDIRGEMSELQKKMDNASKPHSSPRPRQDMPMPHHIFHGRDEFVAEVISLLRSQSTSRVCITAAGGTGKTSVTLAAAASVVKKTVNGVEQGIFDPDYLFWVPCIEAPSADLFRQTLYAQLRITAESYDSLDPLIRELDVSKEPRLLLLDNFETTWLSRDQSEVSSILHRIAALPHVALLVSMTSGYPPESDSIHWEHRPLLPLDPSPARDAFKRKYRAAAQRGKLAANDAGIDLEDTPELEELLKSLGYLPLAVTLMAAFGGRLRTSPAELLKEWREAGTEMISRGANDSMNRTIGFSMHRGVMESDPKALTLLAILSMLPGGTTGQNLRWWAPNLASHCDSLLTAALIEQSDDSDSFDSSTIFVRPTIQAYMAHGDRIPTEVRDQVYAACYQFVLDHSAMDPDNPRFKTDITALRSEQANIHDILMQTDAETIRPNALDALIVFARFQSRTTPSIVVASYALEIAENLHTARRVAEAHMCLGRNLFILDRYDQAAKEFEVAARCFGNLSGGHGDDLHRAGECSAAQAKAWRFNMADKSRDDLHSIVKQAQADLSHDPDDNYHIARGLLAHGEFLRWNNEWDSRQAAIQMLSNAKHIFLQLKSPASRGESLHDLARVHGRLMDYSKALLVAQEALLAAAESGDDQLTGEALGLTAQYLIRCQRYDEAAGLLDKKLSLSRALGSPVTIAQTLEELGLNCAGQMNLSGARGAYAMAQEHYNKIPVDQCRRAVRRCANNLRKLESLSEMDEGWFSTLATPSYWS